MNPEKSLAALFAETQEELIEFIHTRLEILRSEVAEKLRVWKYSVPLLLLAGALLLMSWGLITFALVAMVRAWFLPSHYGWLWAGLIVAALYLIAGFAVGWFAYGELMHAGITPKRTLEVLKQDQVWVKKEARAA